MRYPDYYARLGVAKDASQDEIKKAYRKLARKHHPDLSKEDDAARHMAEVNEANAVLSDPEKRAVYDQVGHQAWAQGARSEADVRPPPGWNRGYEGHAHAQRPHASGFQAGDGSAEGFSDFFEELFGRAAGARARHASAGQGGAQQSAWRGEDEHAAIELALAEAYTGAERTLRLQTVKIDDQGQPVPEVRTLSVKIPAGVAEGQLIRLAGQGQPGYGGGAAGDLLLKVHIKRGPREHVSGRDVHMRVPVSPWEAALGAEIHVGTPAGRLTVTVPAGSGAGRKLRLKGKGIPGAQSGDLFLELEVAVPSAVTEEQKAAWQALALAYPGFDPRPAE